MEVFGGTGSTTQTLSMEHPPQQQHGLQPTFAMPQEDNLAEWEYLTETYDTDESWCLHDETTGTCPGTHTMSTMTNELNTTLSSYDTRAGIPDAAQRSLQQFMFASQANLKEKRTLCRLTDDATSNPLTLSSCYAQYSHIDGISPYNCLHSSVSKSDPLRDATIPCVFVQDNSIANAAESHCVATPNTYGGCKGQHIVNGCDTVLLSCGPDVQSPSTATAILCHGGPMISNGLVLASFHEDSTITRDTNPTLFMLSPQNPPHIADSPPKPKEAQGTVDKSTHVQCVADEQQNSPEMLSLRPPSLPSSARHKILRPLTAYNYFYRDEQQNIVQNMKRHGDLLPPPISDFTPERFEQLLFQRWYIDPTKGKRQHKSVHGKIEFTKLCQVISHRWKALSPVGRQFYKSVALLDKQTYHGYQKQRINTSSNNVMKC